VAEIRYRCGACGNLTRFDVMTDRRTRAFHHYSVGGALSVEEEVVLAEEVVEVRCRWCGHGRSVETLADVAAAHDEPEERAVGD
jgi:DNA-directed RNA polymerase subunit RPC12/RpoP